MIRKTRYFFLLIVSLITLIVSLTGSPPAQIPRAQAATIDLSVLPADVRQATNPVLSGTGQEGLVVSFALTIKNLCTNPSTTPIQFIVPLPNHFLFQSSNPWNFTCSARS